MPISTQSDRSGEHEKGSRASLADALFTSTQQKVLGLLFGQPDKSFFVTQIMGLVKCGRGAVQRELARLLRGGLLTVHKVATQKHYQANPVSPLFDELCSITQKTVGLATPIREAIEVMRGEVRLALIYGSVAKRTDSSSSDIDVLIVANDATLEDAYATLLPVEQVLARRISTTLYSIDEYQQRLDDGNAFLRRVLNGPVIELVGAVDGA